MPDIRRWAVFAVHDDGTKMRLTRTTPDKRAAEHHLDQMLTDPWWTELAARDDDDKTILEVLEVM